MKKRFSLVLTGILLSMLLIFAGCGEGKGAEDTGEDGKVGDHGNDTTTTSDTATTDGGMMDDAERFAEDIMPGGEASNIN